MTDPLIPLETIAIEPAKTYELTVQKKGGYLHAVATGRRTRAAITALAHEVIDACKQHKTDRVVVDVRKLEGRLNIFDSFRLVTNEFPILRQMKVLTRVALVDKRENDDRVMFFETVARNRGYNLHAFNDLDRATIWLMED